MSQVLDSGLNYAQINVKDRVTNRYMTNNRLGCLCGALLQTVAII